MFPPTKKYCPLTRETTAEDRAALYNDLRRYGKFTGLCWLMSPEPAQVVLPNITTVEDIIFSEEFLTAVGLEKQLEILIERIKVDTKLIQEISNMTSDQRDSPSWHMVRRGRLTASNFGHVLKAKRATPSLVKRLLGEYNLSGVKAVTWGVNNEDEGVKAFTAMTNYQ
jgi:hypothetical protein